MKALVTGGGGFLGRYIVEQLLARGDEVTVFARGNYPQLEALGARLVRGDLQDTAAVTHTCRGLDAVFHVAAKTDYWGSWESFYQPNVVGTRNIIEACRQHQVPKLIHTSTPSVVANDRSRSGEDESLPYPSSYESFYPHTKAIAEKMVTEANGSQLLTVSLRPHVVFGPRDRHIIPRLINRARSGQLIWVGDGNNKIDVTYVEDAARAHLLAADNLEPGSATAGSVYFISQDEPVNPLKFVNEILSRLGLPLVTRKLPLPAARVLGGALELAHRLLPLGDEPRLTRFLANELALDHYYNISRAKEDFGYRPQYTMSEAIDRTVQHFQETYTE
jgi:nucleoside-diphosphate-sugar epimerase